MEGEDLIKKNFVQNNYLDSYIYNLFSIACILIIFMIGYTFKNLAFASYGALGISTFNYYKHFCRNFLIKYLFLIGFFMASSNFLGMISSHYKWTVPIVVSLVAFIGRLFFRLYKINKPGPYFSVMFVSIGASSKIEFSQIPLMSIYFIIGMVVSIALAVMFTLFDKQPIETYKIEPLRNRFISDPSVILDSYLYATILFFATYVSFSLKLYNPYWLVISCAAILQGDKLKDAYMRHIQRITGTIIGLMLAALLLEINLSILNQMLIISILYMIVDIFKKKNYTFLLFFSTPMALMLSNLVHHQYIGTLIQYRFISIILGSLIGLFWAWLITITLKFYIKNIHFIEHIKKNKL